MFDHNPDKMYGHFQRLAPTVVKNTTSGASATYQATGTSIGKLHMFSAVEACRVLAGTGSSVTATAGFLVPAGTILFFRPVTGQESMGYATLTGSFTVATIATVE